MNTLCATDFSPAAEAAIDVAAALTRRAGGRLTLLHVVQPPALDVPLLPMGASGWEVQLRQSALGRLERMAAAPRLAGLPVKTMVLFGTPAPAIVDTAKSSGADLVVVGTHGRQGVAHFVLGSVAERVAATAGGPVLVVPTEGAAAFCADGTLRVLLAADGSPAALAARDALGALCGALPATDVSIVRLVVPMEEAARYGLEMPWELETRAPHRDLLLLVQRDLERFVAPLVAQAARVAPRVRAVERDPTDDLRAEADAVAPDLIVVGRRRGLATGPWRTLRADAVLRAARVAVLCVPDGVTMPRTLPRLQKVLIPTDLTPLGNLAIPHGYGLLAKDGGCVELCHVHARSTVAWRPTALRPELGEADRAAIEAKLRALAPPDAEAMGITTHVLVVEGITPAQAIVQTAERLAVDAIALGTHGRGAAARVVKGSVAETVARTASRPVLLVHAPR